MVRREFDLGEGDAYNKVLIDRAERRLNNLGYFKRVRITNEPGSAPDRVVVNVDVEDQSTGSFSVSGGYSTADGFIGEVCGQRDRTSSAAASMCASRDSYGERTQGVDFSFTEPYFLGYRLAAGIDLFSKFSDQTKYARYENRVTGGQLRLGLPVTEEFGVTLRYSLYQQDLEIPNDIKQPFNDCYGPDPRLYGPERRTGRRTGSRAKAMAKRRSRSRNRRATRSLRSRGMTFNYNSLDNAKDPRNGFYAELKTDFAGLGGDSHFFRATGDARYYHEFLEDIVGIGRVQGGHILGFGGDDLRHRRPLLHGSRRSCAASPRRASVRATSRPSTAGRTRSAARPISAVRSKCSSRSSACRGNSA